MKTKKAIKNIKSEIYDVNLIINSLEEKTIISEIELDICLEKLRNVYTLLGKLRSTSEYAEDIKSDAEIIKPEPEITIREVPSSSIEKATSHEKSISKIELPVEDQVTDIIPVDDKETYIEEKVEIESAIIQNENITSVNEATNIFSEKIQIETKLRTSQQKKKEGKIVADSINSDKRSINDLISMNKLDNDLSSRFKQKKIDDLNKAISLNDKIWFTKELFNGNNDEFNNTISNINSTNDLEDALNYITDNYNWDSDNKIVQKFLSIVSRRFQ